MVMEIDKKGNVVLPDGFQQRRLADILVASDQSQAFCARSSADQAVGWISWIFVGKLSRQSCDFWSYRLHCNSFDQFLDRALDGSIPLNSSSGNEQSQFPESNG